MDSCCATIRREISDEKQPIEGAFLACTLWLADAYVLAGEIDKAQALFDRVVAVANDLGLLAEEFDSGAERQTGNFPQALTHIALINTAHNLSDAEGEAGDAAVEVRRRVPRKQGLEYADCSKATATPRHASSRSRFACGTTRGERRASLRLSRRVIPQNHLDRRLQSLRHRSRP